MSNNNTAEALARLMEIWNVALEAALANGLSKKAAAEAVGIWLDQQLDGKESA
jgi:hypothetical protein